MRALWASSAPSGGAAGKPKPISPPRLRLSPKSRPNRNQKAIQNPVQSTAERKKILGLGKNEVNTMVASLLLPAAPRPPSFTILYRRARTHADIELLGMVVTWGGDDGRVGHDILPISMGIPE